MVFSGAVLFASGLAGIVLQTSSVRTEKTILPAAGATRVNALVVTSASNNEGKN
jgi:hypothetical protein